MATFTFLFHAGWLASLSAQHWSLQRLTLSSESKSCDTYRETHPLVQYSCAGARWVWYTHAHTHHHTPYTHAPLCAHTRTYITHNPHTNTHITYTHTSHTSYTCTSYVHTHRHTYTHTQSTSRKMILTHFLSHVEGAFFRSVNSVFTRSSSSVTHNACHIINILRCMRQ